ncbi:DNA repair protein RadA [Candidatus Parcubacteria bacterium]|nr:DNA repair protein RadA [Candidatus Parcubacteria bacterium]
MAKVRTVFICQSCSAESPRWQGRCPQCGEWNTFVETVVSTATHKVGTPRRGVSTVRPLGDVAGQSVARIVSGIGEFDRVVGGGLVPGQAILLAGEPGIGKSTLLLQVASALVAGEDKSSNSPLPSSTEDTSSTSLELKSNLKNPKEELAILQSSKEKLAIPQSQALKNPQKPGFFPRQLGNSDSTSILYVAGEESVEQIGLRARRLGISSQRIDLVAETDVDLLGGIITSLKGDYVVVVDSIQALATTDLSGAAGSVGQVRECALRLVRGCKEGQYPLILVGHVTKEGTLAGPKVLEHLVDTVIALEGDRFHAFRILRASKNRFGPTDEVGVFEMKERGMIEVANPSDRFLSERLQGVSGSVVTAVMEGTRPVLLEIQALTTPTSFGYPRRTTSGISQTRLLVLLAVLEKRLGLSKLLQSDVYVSVAGGVRVSEPAADLAVCLAVASSLKDVKIDPKIVALGEVGLSGEVRNVYGLGRRVKEAKRLGFSRIVGPDRIKSIQEAYREVITNRR